MSAREHYLDVTVLDREYRFSCSPEEREALQNAVRMVDERMRKASASKNMTAERAAVMTAVNIAHEFLDSGKIPPPNFDTPEIRRTIENMGARLDEILTSQTETMLF